MPSHALRVRRTRLRGALGVVLLLALAACQPRPPAEPTAYLAPSIAAIPTATQTIIAPAQPTARPRCANGASFLEDLTIPDGSEVSPGETLDKRWSVQNSGTCDWSSGYRLVRLDSSEIGGQQELALYPARAGEIAVWQVQLVAPEQPGEYLASWQARSPDGELFGDQVFVLIEVRR